VAERGEKPFRAEQLSRHYFAGHSLDQRTDLGAAATERLAPLLPELWERVRDLSCDEGATIKTLWRGHDRTLVESVTMRYRDRTTVCISSQAGCGMACPFCATGQGGLTRNLSTAEIVDQVVRANADELGRGERGVTNVVFMGMGEPLANYNRVVGALHRLVEPSPHGLGMSQRNIVVSTVGLVPAIRKLADEGLQVTLALSLHAPDDELRNTLVPVNTRWPVREVLEAALGYVRSTGRRLSIEYALIRDVNDQPWRADLLAKRLKGKLVHVNLIPLNPTPGSEWDASPKPVQDEFVRRLRAAGVNATVRDTRGREIAGACGQLAALE
jgi:23S rRNA (adenine2503-C2)-methyltransferase